MTTRWSPDTCDCVLLFQVGTTTFVQWEQVCDLHKAFTGQTLLNTVIAHNLTFQISIPNQNNKMSRNANMATKIAAKAAIIAGGATLKNSAFIQPRMFGNN